ncbi:ureidoglycolate lyase [Pseudodonghicola flavimaris]|uniref:Ureidoglycolate lyase n=1 Tax=Pseudodonghicola flavimaris TaxID=3050036 RepID=A0ABT7EZP9_9RHOB|nr:ureidoglycolate lyase [Pseudodonghicola flavimaris]MDK3017809.1 ureidoglycolate lyase [Pseudodonghicola flavimaris]
MTVIRTEPLTATAFAPFGDVIALKNTPDRIINQGLCGRHHDLARVETDAEGRTGISLFDAEPRALPYRLEMMERHPLGSQAFLPLSPTSFLVIVAADAGGRPATPRAFLTAPGQGINLLRNVWHGVLTPLSRPGLFAVIDRIGPGDNLEEYWFDTPYRVETGP